MGTTGALVIPPQWDFAFAFAGDYCAVKLKNKWGFIDRQGKVVIPIEWDMAASFHAVPTGPAFCTMAKKIGPGKALAVYLGPNLKEIWRAELPLEQEK